MKSDVIVLFCALSLFLTVVSGAINVTEDVCAALTEDQKCCNMTGCMWFSCENATEEAKNITKCHLGNWTEAAECKNNTQKPMCTTPAPTPTTAATPPPTVTPEVDPCKDGQDKVSCCAITNCTYTNCTSQDTTVTSPLEVCVKDPSTRCKAGTIKDQCAVVPTTTTPTAAPTTDVCEDYKNEADCCSNVSNQNCSYISCTGKDDKPHTGCHVNTTDMANFCKGAVQSKCAATPNPDVTTPVSTTSTQSSDASANKAQAEHGQHFDAASFIGGIVLCLGLVAIIFFGLKFYRAKTERNYHTL